MPKLRDRVRETLGRLEAAELRDQAAEFRAAAASVETRARRERTLPLFAEGYGRATAMAQALVGRDHPPKAVRGEAGDWLERDRGWQAELATVREFTGPQGTETDPSQRREATRLPAVAEAIQRETGRIARLPALERGIAWTGDRPLVSGDRIAFQAGGQVLQAVVVSPGESGGMRDSDAIRLRIADARKRQVSAEGRLVETGVQALRDGGCIRAAWSDEGLRELELARQRSVPIATCRLPCPQPVPGDRIAWTEAAGIEGGVRTIEAVVATRTATANGSGLELRAVRASGPGAPEPGSSIGRSTEAVTARGCYRAPWADEARRERILDPPERTQEQTRDRDRDTGFSM